MGKRGPKPADKTALELRGSWRAKAPKSQSKKPAKPFDPKTLDAPAKKLAASIKNWKEVLRTIPLYDPYRDAGDCVFDKVAACRAIVFFETRLQHIEGRQFAGKYLKLEKWQRAIIANLFGWKRKDGTRRYRLAYIEIPTRNGKSVLASGVALYLLLCDGEDGAQVYSAAAEKEQSKIVFNVAKNQVAADPQLNGLVNNGALKIYAVASSMVLADTCVYKALSAQAYSKHGLNAHGIIFDELHAQKDRELWDVMQSRTGSRVQPLTFTITTAGYDKTSICWEQHEYALSVRQGSISDPYFLPVIYAADPKDDWKSEDVWYKANPNLCISKSIEYMRAQCAKAVNTPGYESQFKRDHLNIWTDSIADRWISAEKWAECPHILIPDNTLKTSGKCYAGIDLARSYDLTALALWFPRLNAVKLWSWLPATPNGQSLKEVSKRDHADYETWARQQYLMLHPGDTLDFDILEDQFRAILDEYKPSHILVDKAKGDELFSHLLASRYPIDGIRQGDFSLDTPSRWFEKLIIDKAFNGMGNPILEYCVSNCAIILDTKATDPLIRAVKLSPNLRIDLVSATINAIAGAIKYEPKKRMSAYETQELILI